MCIFFVLNVEKHQKCFYKARAARNKCSKWNIDRSKCALAATQDMCIFFVLNVVKHQKSVRFVIFVRKGISIIASALAATDKIFNNYSMSARWI